MKFARAPRRYVGRTMRNWRDGALRHVPASLRDHLDPAVDTVDMLLVDHGIFRLVYSNTHRLGDKAWRSSQPTPATIRGMAARGVRTVVNLRGERDCGAFRLEAQACAAAGIDMVTFIVRSRAAPTRETILAAKDLFDRLTYPIMMHCKSGADRVGLMSALYMIFREGMPVRKARKQLHWRFGHFRQADTGILDTIFDAYIDYDRNNPIDFLEWVRTVYDSEALTRAFKANSAGNVLVNTILRRE